MWGRYGGNSVCGQSRKGQKASGKERVEMESMEVTPVILGVRGRIYIKIWASVFDIIMYPLSRWFGDRE